LFGKLLVKSISYYCLAFPAIDVVSAFPLMAIGLGNNLAATCDCCGDEEGLDEDQMSRRVTVFRLLATLPPLIGACFMSNLGAITSYTGISGCFLGFIFPPLLSLYSERYFERRQWNSDTIHSRSWATCCRYGMVVFGVVLIAFVLGMTIANPMDAHDL
jgi:amino acid permease